VVATTRQAYQLIHNGSLALSKVEANGVRIDVDRLDRTIRRTAKEISRREEVLAEMDVAQKWRKMYGRKTSYGSRRQLGKVLWKMGYRWEKKTEKTKQPAVDEEVLNDLDCSFVQRFLKVEKLKKLQSTYLEGLRTHVSSDGLLHAVFNLHIARTFRSSSSDPNFQNIPVRDKFIGKLIRSCFIPRDGHSLMEIDFSGLEVRIAACYHKDPMMLEYIRTGYDLHMEMACRCFLLDESQVSKDARYCAKNTFVFPEFYGSYFGKIGPNMWESIRRLKLKTVDGKSLYEHLKEKGIKKLGKKKSHDEGRIETESGTFLDHIREEEKILWGDRFQVYAQWKIDWFRQYMRRGYFHMFTGFREEGVFKRNDVINYPVQGAAFHCLLWCLIELQKWIDREGMKTKIVGQIHDSIIADVPHDEREKFTQKVKELMTEDIIRHWKWIIVPLDIDIEASDKNWYEKEEVELVV